MEGQSRSSDSGMSDSSRPVDSHIADKFVLVVAGTQRMELLYSEQEFVQYAKKIHDVQQQQFQPMFRMLGDPWTPILKIVNGPSSEHKFKVCSELIIETANTGGMSSKLYLGHVPSSDKDVVSPDGTVTIPAGKERVIFLLKQLEEIADRCVGAVVVTDMEFERLLRSNVVRDGDRFIDLVHGLVAFMVPQGTKIEPKKVTNAGLPTCAYWSNPKRLQPRMGTFTMKGYSPEERTQMVQELESVGYKAQTIKQCDYPNCTRSLPMDRPDIACNNCKMTFDLCDTHMASSKGLCPEGYGCSIGLKKSVSARILA